MRTIVFALVAAAALAGCNPAHQYPPEVRQQFVTSCQASGAPAPVCECTFRKVEAELTLDQFIELDRATAAGRQHASMPRVQELALGCAANPNS